MPCDLASPPREFTYRWAGADVESPVLLHPAHGHMLRPACNACNALHAVHHLETILTATLKDLGHMMEESSRGVDPLSAMSIIMLSADWRREGSVTGRCLEDSWTNMTVTHV